MNSGEAEAPAVLLALLVRSKTDEGLYTRRGDRGETSLYGPRRVPKDDPRVEAYGTIDELNTIIGVVIAGSKRRVLNAQLKEVQKLLFVAGGDMATELSGSGSQRVPRITHADTLMLETLTDDLAERLPRLTNFILPGGGPSGASLQLARAVCRRAERRVVTASASGALNPELLPFFNRLSSYLFNASRWANRVDGRKEDAWKPSRG